MDFYFESNKSPFNLHIAQPDELIEVSECVSEVYSGRFYKQELLDPEYLKKSTSLTVFTATDKNGRCASTLAFEQPLFLPGVYSIIMHSVRKEYRGINLGFELTRYALGIFLEKDCTAIIASAITNHSAGQHQLEKCGMIPTGLLVNLTDSKKNTMDMGTPQKQTAGIYVIPNRKRDAGRLYIPAEIRRFTEEIYSSLGVSYIINTDSAPTEKSEYEFCNDEYHNTLYIHINKCGKGIFEEINNIQSRYLKHPLQSSIVYLNISDVSAVYGFNALTQNGFVFTGFSPLCKQREYIVLFNKMNSVIDIQSIKATDSLQKIIDNIKLLPEA